MERNISDFLSKNAISQVAKLHGVSESEIREEMNRALFMAWENENEIAMDVRNRMFPREMPTPEVFIGTIAKTLCKDI